MEALLLTGCQGMKSILKNLEDEKFGRIIYVANSMLNGAQFSSDEH
jgi:hypothetical protein